MIDKTQTICKEIFITNLLFAFKFNVIMTSLVRIYQVSLEGQSQADCCVWSCACGLWWIYLQLALYSVSHIPPLCLYSAFPQTNAHSCFIWARANHPPFVRPLLLVKSEHQSFAVSRDNRTLWRLQFTPYTNTDLNLNDQAKLELNVNLVNCHVSLPSQAVSWVILIDDYLNWRLRFIFGCFHGFQFICDYGRRRVLLMWEKISEGWHLWHGLFYFTSFQTTMFGNFKVFWFAIGFAG